MGNATTFDSLPPVVHVFDGGPSDSGILDPAREVTALFPRSYAGLIINPRSRTASSISHMPIGRLEIRNGLTVPGESWMYVGASAVSAGS